ncbi:glycosyltransferase family 1 protein [Sediminibacterium ginsengisoli]|uniref:Glycosyl transferases group 1 n=1 Tax=Sediminibacterium ginsengisoli TaxID=413434 RepID=A0A1T4Q2J7_9BACT|nr:glycosyltransferase family 1 protein [Sediminibacterium ginsengisoli]SJZ98020.1 Glycosyl transferases group 1 [Sediminibacterium ginsengisoli]
MNLICFSHLRWGFVYQRPQHVLTRLAKKFTVYFVEEPVFNAPMDKMLIETGSDNLYIAVPHLQGDPCNDTAQRTAALLKSMLHEYCINDYFFWYYTPMALKFTRDFHPQLTVYDCMDELSAFRYAPAELQELEAELFRKADLVFTGGQSLYEAKKDKHANIHPFPSSIDKAHFAKARQKNAEPEDQQDIPHPRIGFFGVIDERFDCDLISKVAFARPDWHFVFLGPVVKVQECDLPQAANIHYLGIKSYDVLPQYISGWDIAIIPFALNESTQFISPTKTPEYLAAGKPVISTPIRDVVQPYGTRQLVHIAHSATEFVEAVEEEIATKDKRNWLKEVDTFLADHSWDKTCAEMAAHIRTISASNIKNRAKEVQYV